MRGTIRIRMPASSDISGPMLRLIFIQISAVVSDAPTPGAARSGTLPLGLATGNSHGDDERASTHSILSTSDAALGARLVAGRVISQYDTCVVSSGSVTRPATCGASRLRSLRYSSRP